MLRGFGVILRALISGRIAIGSGTCALCLDRKMFQSLENWTSYLECLVEAYFGLDAKIENLSEHEMMLLKHFEELRLAGFKFKTETKFYPLESIIVAFLLSSIPYILFRGPISRIVRLFVNKKK